MQTRQVQAFEFDNLLYAHHAPLTPQNLPRATHVDHQSLQFEGFDASLGNLVGAYLSYQGTFAIQYLVTAGTRPPRWNEQAVWGGTVTGMAYCGYGYSLSVGGGAGPIGATIDTGAMTTVASGGRHSGLYYLRFDGSGPKDMGDGTIDGAYRWEPWVTLGDLDSPPIDLADGLDVSGPTVDVDLTRRITLYMAPFFSSFEDPDESYVLSDLNRWFGRVALTYVYETGAPVPAHEPGSLMLVVLGMLALVPSRRASP